MKTSASRKMGQMKEPAIKLGWGKQSSFQILGEVFMSAGKSATNWLVAPILVHSKSRHGPPSQRDFSLL
jgi:hypothetical protein